MGISAGPFGEGVALKMRRAIVGLIAITVMYLSVLVWMDARDQVFNELPTLIAALPILLALSLISYIIRYLRWYWLLKRAGSKTKFSMGFLAYLSGFALTATPGKVGELLRIRYLSCQGVPPWKVLAAFVYERGVDLLAVLLLATLAISRTEIFLFVLVFVTVLILLLVFLAHRPFLLSRSAVMLRWYGFKRLSHIARVFKDGLVGSRFWMTPKYVLFSLFLGLVAWGITAFSFTWLLNVLGGQVPVLTSLSIYPLAMLAGAASMIPGGVGSTEVTIVALLSMSGVSLGIATLVAVCIRFASIWFSVLCGIMSIVILEAVFYREAVVRQLNKI